MKLTYFLVGIALVGAATFYLVTRDPNADGYLNNYAFQKFKRTFGVEYQHSAEESYRFSVFLENFKSIEQHNSNPKKTYTREINKFADLTKEEFSSRYLMESLPSQMNKNLPKLKLNNTSTSQPIDWTTKNVLPGVQDQKQCFSSWAFSTAGLLESIYNIKNKPANPINFSEQQLIDCCGAEGFGCEGCNGAQTTDAISYTQQYGIVQESQYQYTGKDGACKTELQGTGFKPSQQFLVDATNAAVQAALQNSPLSISVDASNWRDYHSGIFPQSNCNSNPNFANHAVLLVGFNANQTWKVRNSWGTSWGQSGYITLAAGNTCGLENNAIYATV